MVLHEENRDLFTVPTDYALVHCISADFALGAGIAREFTKRGVKASLKDMYATPSVGSALATFTTGWAAEYNLVTKEKYWQKPTYAQLKQALVSLRSVAASHGRTKLAMPKIGCGLDRLEWNNVKDILCEVFENTDTEILVCSL